MTNSKLNEELKEMSIYVYGEGDGSIPNGWDIVRVDSNKKTTMRKHIKKAKKSQSFIGEQTLQKGLMK